MEDYVKETGRRQFPRREYERKIGLLCQGHYFIVQAGEIGEGGLSFMAYEELKSESQIVVTLQIPNGDFVSLRGAIRYVKNEDSGQFLHGISFENIMFNHKRQIRMYVSGRSN